MEKIIYPKELVDKYFKNDKIEQSGQAVTGFLAWVVLFISVFSWIFALYSVIALGKGALEALSSFILPILSLAIWLFMAKGNHNNIPRGLELTENGVRLLFNLPYLDYFISYKRIKRLKADERKNHGGLFALKIYALHSHHNNDFLLPTTVFVTPEIENIIVSKTGMAAPPEKELEEMVG
jgi:hypothetical protein